MVPAEMRIHDIRFRVESLSRPQLRIYANSKTDIMRMVKKSGVFLRTTTAYIRHFQKPSIEKVIRYFCCFMYFLPGLFTSE